jgi:hypothetical protein
MNFDYYTLKRAAKDGLRLGNWNGKAVFAASASNLDSLGSGAFYILYDDDNKIVGRDGKHFYSYGTVSGSGSVNEYNSRRRYNAVCETQHNHSYEVNATMKYSSEPIPAATAAVSYTPGYDANERPVGDVKTEIDVEKTLKMAREMTIEDLLEGFLPGVSYDTVAKG